MCGRNAACAVLRLAGRGGGVLAVRVRATRGCVVRTRVLGAAGFGGGGGIPWTQVLKGRSHSSQ